MRTRHSIPLYAILLLLAGSIIPLKAANVSLAWDPSPDAAIPGKIVGYLRDKVGITFAGGQDQLKGKITRVAHLGYIGTFDIITAMAALEMGIAAFGKPVDFGKGVGAAQKILMAGMPAAPAA